MRSCVSLLPSSALLSWPATAKCWIAPQTAPVTPMITLLNFRNTFCIDAVVKIWSKSDKWLRRYYVIFEVTIKNNKNYAPTESDSCHTADTLDNLLTADNTTTAPHYFYDNVTNFNRSLRTIRTQAVTKNCSLLWNACTWNKLWKCTEWYSDEEWEGSTDQKTDPPSTNPLRIFWCQINTTSQSAQWLSVNNWGENGDSGAMYSTSCLYSFTALHNYNAISIPVSATNNRCHLRSATHGDLAVPRVRLAKYGRSFSASGLLLWYSLLSVLLSVMSWLNSAHDWRLFYFPELTGHHHSASLTISAVKFACANTNLLTYLLTYLL